MPETKLQEVVFALLMSFFMVLGMEFYNGSIQSLMCPAMSFWATLIFHGISLDFVNQWFGTVIRNFPMAFFWQIFYCGPLVWFLFGRIFFGRREKTV